MKTKLKQLGFKKYKGKLPPNGQTFLGRYKGDNKEYKFVSVNTPATGWMQYKGKTGIVNHEPDYIKLLPKIKEMVLPNYY